MVHPGLGLFAPFAQLTERGNWFARTLLCQGTTANSESVRFGSCSPAPTTVNFPTWRAPSPQIRARDTSFDGTTNGSAGIDSAPNVDAGIDGATHLGGQRCRDHEDRGDSAAALNEQFVR